MDLKNAEAFRFLSTRRSRPAKTLAAPGPDEEELGILLNAAARVPDHGALVPFRFLVLGGKTLHLLSKKAPEVATRLSLSEEAVLKSQTFFENAPVLVGVVQSLKDSPKIPDIEQVYTSGAVCLSLVNAALARGWGANWITGFMCYADETHAILSLGARETLAGFIALGQETTPPQERIRPDLNKIVTHLP